MLSRCVPRLRRRVRSPYVLKYLEGVPVPRKLVDHLAGADLSSTPSIAFFTTVPRYVNSVHEQRLSRLFFHHVLYPAGGARMPYQAVVVRGGRSVRTSTPHYSGGSGDRSVTSHTQSTRTTSMTTTTTRAASDGSDAGVTSVPLSRRVRDPLAVPTSQRVCAPPPRDAASASSSSPTHAAHSVPAEVYASEAQWSRADAARRPFFYTPRAAHESSGSEVARGEYAMATPRVHIWRRSASQQCHTGTTTMTTKEANVLACGSPSRLTAAPRPLPPRTTHDTVLAPLCGVAAHAYTQLLRGDAAVSALTALFVNDSAGLLSVAPRVEDNNSKSTTTMTTTRRHEYTLQPLADTLAATTAADNTSALPPSRRECVLAQVLHHVRHTPRHAYVQLQLPHDAVVRIPLPAASSTSTACDNSDGDDSSSGSATTTAPRLLCRIAGGVEPHVTFAVGTPLLQQQQHTATTTTAERDAEAMLPFSHITCLARVHSTHAQSTHALTAAAARASMHGGSMDSVVHEPWRLGSALDALLPLRARTATERSVHASSAVCAGAAATMYIVGRCEAETYVLPQRELLLRVFVPPTTAAMCAAQNRDRLALQAKLGHASAHDVHAADSSSSDDKQDDNGVVWRDNVLLTAARLRHGELCNLHTAAAANDATQSHNNTQSKGSNSGSSSGGDALTSYQVRALPGDVVYVPRGWGYSVARITGTALVDQDDMATTRAGAQNSGSAARRYGVQPLQSNRHVGLQTTSTTTTAVPAAVATTATGAAVHDHQQRNNNEKGATERDALAVDVDALCLVYKPYPVLTRDQARVYVAANYVHHGIDEFYRNGGNAAYHKYE